MKLRFWPVLAIYAVQVLVFHILGMPLIGAAIFAVGGCLIYIATT